MGNKRPGSLNGVARMPEMSVRLSRFIAETRDALPPEVTDQVRKALLDYLACALAGARTDGARVLASYLHGQCPSGNAGVIGMAMTMSPPAAAFVNGTSGHALEMDDGHRAGALHPGVVIFPTTLALAQARDDTGLAEVMGAVVVGYELMIRLSAGGHPATRFRGFHNTAVAGVFGAAAAAARLLKLPAQAANHALGLAGSFAAGLFAFLQNGADTKKLHPGKSARDGIICAELAERGMTGPNEVFEGKDGYFTAYAGSVDEDKVLRGLGDRYGIMDIYFKPYPCCRHLHGAIDAVRELKRIYGLRPSHVRAIRVGTYEVAARHDRRDCRNLLDAQMSLPYAVALALVQDDVALQGFRPDEGLRRKLQPVIDKVHVEVDGGCEADYPAKRPAVVEIALVDGKTVSQRVDEPWGSTSNLMSQQDVERKFLEIWNSEGGSDEGHEVVGLVSGGDSIAALRRAVDLCVEWGRVRA